MCYMFYALQQLIDNHMLTDLLYYRLYEWNKAIVLPENDGSEL